MNRGLLGVLLLHLHALGCGDAPVAGGDAGVGAVAEAWTPLMIRSWTMDPGSEEQPDYGGVADRDYAITAIRAVDPPGTHHVDILGPGPVHNTLFVSVIGTGAFYFPAGVGLRIRKGDELTLQLHIVNASDHVVEGASGLEVLEAPDAAALEEANILNPAATELELPPGASTVSRTCTLTEDQTLFAIAPHMHELGVHFKATLTQRTGTRVLLDEDFAWNEQVFEPLEPIATQAGDSITVECSWNNTTAETVNWGTTSDKEMCSAFVYRYPVGGSGFCTE